MDFGIRFQRDESIKEGKHGRKDQALVQEQDTGSSDLNYKHESGRTNWK